MSGNSIKTVIGGLRKRASNSLKWKLSVWGSGSAAFSDSVEPAKTAVELCGKSADKCTVLYVGTATYDLQSALEKQTFRFAELGCTITSIAVATQLPADMQLKVDAADIILVSGGNSLFCIDRWETIGLNEMFRQAMDQGTVMSGGSCGAMCWFDGGHSDSGDPESYYVNMKSEEGTALAEDEKAKTWRYMRVSCLGLLPSLMCPHYDRVQSNGVLRATDFDSMMLKHSQEHGICIDHWAGLIIDGEDYRVVSIDDKDGSVLADGGFSADRKGTPGLWVTDVVDGKVERKLAPKKGLVTELMKEPTSPIVEDAEVADCRVANPQVGEE